MHGRLNSLLFPGVISYNLPHVRVGFGNDPLQTPGEQTVKYCRKFLYLNFRYCTPSCMVASPVAACVVHFIIQYFSHTGQFNLLSVTHVKHVIFICTFQF